MENKEIVKLNKILEKESIEEILIRKVTRFGTSAKIGASKKHIGKEAIVIIKKNPTRE